MNAFLMEGVESRVHLSGGVGGMARVAMGGGEGAVAALVVRAARAARRPSIVGWYEGTSRSGSQVSSVVLRITKQGPDGTWSGRFSTPGWGGSFKISGTVDTRGRITFRFSGRDAYGRAEGGGTAKFAAGSARLTGSFTQVQGGEVERGTFALERA